MIPRTSITGWRAEAPWKADEQVEQDLLLSRTLVELFSDELISEQLAFRGGTALHKLFLPNAARYSEDIDLVQVKAVPSGEMMSRIRTKLVPWLGKAQYKQSQGRITFYFRYQSEIPPIQPMRLKIEINTQEHNAIFGHSTKNFAIESDWFTGQTQIKTFSIEELLGTKLRALFQRKKGRDLFDQWICYQSLAPDPEKIVIAFNKYVKTSGLRISRAEFEANLEAKETDPAFHEDVLPLLRNPDAYDFQSALTYVRETLLSQLK